MTDSMIFPQRDEVQLALVALEKTEKSQYVTPSEDPVTTAPKRVIIECLKVIYRAISIRRLFAC